MTGMAWAGRLGIVIALIIIERASPALAWVLVIAAAIGAFAVFLYGGRYLPGPILAVADRMTGKTQARSEATAPELIDEQELSAFLKARVIGQNEVIDALARRLRQRLAARREGKPVAVMCFAGAPGVGKTYLARMLAEKLYGGADHLHVFEMAKFRDEYSASSLFGVAAGLTGHGEPGLLSRALRDTPNGIVLLDEFEKANRAIHLQFLSAWNDGFLTDLGTSSKIATTEAIFILTTNAGWPRLAELAADPLITQDEMNEQAKNALQDADFAPEVMSRIDDVFAFRELTGLDVARVVALEIARKAGEYRLEVAHQGIDWAILLQAIKDFSATKPKGGVRDISRQIENRIADGLIEAKAEKARFVRFEADGRRIKVIAVDEGEDETPARTVEATREAEAAVGR
ncbi:MAG: ATP-dependent Clp protease ATP-binding subunit [Hyphomicrobiaceae bacterium]|nr:ATP-dependent Clp protease ATP-binding subunit [Hyphomicrobiaceae bacterium]